MQQELLVAVFAGLGGMLGWGFADFFAKKTIDRVGAFVSLVWAHAFGTLALLAIALFQVYGLGKPLSIPTNIEVWSLLALFGALQAVVYLLAYQGFGKGQLAVLNPIFASYSGLAALISILIFKELVPSYLLLILGVIFGGILMLSLDIKGLNLGRFNLIGPGVKEVGMAALFAAIWTVSWDKFVGGQDWVLYALAMYIFMTITALLIALAYKTKLSSVPSDLWKFLVLIGFCEVVAYLAISLGFSATSYTSTVALLSGAFSLPTIILARVFLKEKVTTIQTIGSIVIILGIVLLAINQ